MTRRDAREGKVADTNQAVQEAQQAQEAGGASTEQEQADRKPVTFDAWIASQDDSTKKLIDDHVAGLKVVLAEQKQRGAELSKQLKEAMKATEAGSEARKALDVMTAQLEAAEARAAFFEEAIKPEVRCNNPRLAYIAAQDSGAIDAKGRIGWDSLKAQFPELFTQKVPPASAGAGTQAQPPKSGGMNQFIRQAAGRT
jgi:hypothetical protein